MNDQGITSNAFPTYVDDPKALKRLRFRWARIVEPILHELQDCTVLDLAAHDGRWAFAFALAGAREVTAVEPRSELVRLFDAFPAGPVKAKVKVECAEAIDYLERAAAAGQRFDIVAILGFLYHMMEHQRLFRLVQRLRPQIIVIDSEFLMTNNGVIQITAERTDKALNAVAAVAGEEKALVGTPSIGAMRRMAEMIGYELTWISAPDMTVAERRGVEDYYREGRKRRRVCLLHAQGK